MYMCGCCLACLMWTCSSTFLNQRRIEGYSLSREKYGLSKNATVPCLPSVANPILHQRCGLPWRGIK